MSQICSMYLSLSMATGEVVGAYRQLDPAMDDLHRDGLGEMYYYIDADGDPTWMTYFEEGGENEALDRLRAEARAFMQRLLMGLEGMTYESKNTGDDE